jgi:hypothetical protein
MKGGMDGGMEEWIDMLHYDDPNRMRLNTISL